MELKDFIKETVQQIIDATSDLIAENNGSGALINPTFPSPDSEERMVVVDGQYCPVTKVEFDVAVTDGTKKGGGGGASVNVVAVKLKGSADAEVHSENASRIRFELRLVLPAALT